MSTFQRILMATDLDEPSEPAAHTAVSLARDHRAELVFVHVIASPTAMYSAYPDLTAHVPMDDLRNAADWAFRDWVARIDAPAQVRRIIRPGEPAEAILEEAESFSASVIVVGTHGRRGISRALLGSTAETLVRLSSIPVLTVRAPAPTP